MPVVPIRGRFESWRALLASIMEDDDVERIAIVTSCKDGSMKFAHFEMSREQMAYASLIMQMQALE
jgi:hypothetical protein